jgi:hypothetical protein
MAELRKAISARLLDANTYCDQATATEDLIALPLCMLRIL